MNKCFFLCLIFIFFSLNAIAEDEIKEGKAFLSWLDNQKDYFLNCSPKATENGYELCDKTQIKKDQLIKLFKMSPDELVSFIKEEKIHLKIFCKSESPVASFKKYCEPSTQNKAQKEARLQGQFHPETNTIDLQDDAYTGSLVHEYIHYLQYNNENKIEGKRYKFERALLQKKLTRSMEDSTNKVEEALKNKDEPTAKKYIAQTLAASEVMMSFSPWQDLIDEKNIFLLYIKFGNEFGARTEDVQLAQKNMGFICKRLKLPDDQCPKEGIKVSDQIYPNIIKMLQELRPKLEAGEIEKFLTNLPTIDSSKTLEEKASLLNHYIFTTLNIKPDQTYSARNNKDNFLPDSTLKYKKAHCLGLTLLYLMAAEKAGIKAYFVRTPAHVFPRLCDEQKCINIETLKKGESVPDKYYIENGFITKQSIEKGFYLQNLNSFNEIAASIYLGLGYVSASQQNWDMAELFYKKSIDHSRGFAEAYSNLAAVYYSEKKINLAHTYLDIAVKINPDFTPALVNLGILYREQGEQEKALSLFNSALAINPTLAKAYQYRSLIFSQQQKRKDAYLDLERALIVEPKYCDVLEQQLKLTSDTQLKKKKEKTLKALLRNKKCLYLSAGF